MSLLSSESDGPLVRATRLRKSYGERTVVRDVSLTIKSGEIVAFIGPNGAGKSTSLELLLGLRALDAGEVSWCGIDARRDVGVQLQVPPVFPGLSVLDNLALTAALYSPRARLDLAGTLKKCGLSDVARVDADKLSGGQLKRLAIAMALVHSPRLLVLDEPTAALDPRAQVEIRNLIRSFAVDGHAIILATHELRDAQELATRVVLLQAGEILAEGSPAELLLQHGVSSLSELYLALIQDEAAQ